MPDDDQTGQPGASGDPIDDAIDDGAATANPALSLTPEQIRNSPEYRALAKENRKLARQAGDANTAAAAARTAAEEARQAAEAQQQAALEADITGMLGEEGVALWGELATLSESDPRAAARRLAEALTAAGAQSAAAGGDGAAGEGGASAGDQGVPANTPPPPPGRGVDGSQPLGAAASGEDLNQVISALEKSYSDIVERVQDPLTRNRVTMRERATGFINYLGGAYLKAGAKPKEPLT